MAAHETRPALSSDDRAETPRVALLGLGAMGARMARRLLDAGFDLTVYNRSAEPVAALVSAGAARAESPRAAAAAADVVLSMVTDDAASRSVWDAPETGVLAGLKRGALAIESSTVTPKRIAELDARVRAGGAALLDAPVAGSRPQADAGALIHLVGGRSADIERARPIFEALGQRVMHFGPVGAGATAKLAVNALFAVQVAAFAEVVELMTRGGLDRQTSIEQLSAMPITSPAIAGIARLMAADAHAPLFPIDLVAKDLRYARATALEQGGPASLVTAAGHVFESARSAGLGASNISGVARLHAAATA